MDIVLITRGDRPELFKQTIESMKKNAKDWSKHRLVVVFDGTWKERNEWWKHARIDVIEESRSATTLWIATGDAVGVGGAKNHGAEWTQNNLPGKLRDILMFSDSDMYYLPDWDIRLERALRDPVKTLAPPLRTITQLGGWRHPFHHSHHIDGIGYTNEQRLQVDAVTGNCFVMRWADWLTYGPFEEGATGPGQSEDYALSRKIVGAGGLVATLDPPVAIHCGLVNSAGELAVGWKEMAELAQEQGRQWPNHKVTILLPSVETMRKEGVLDPRPMVYGKVEGIPPSAFEPREPISNGVVTAYPPQIGRLTSKESNLESRLRPITDDRRPVGLNIGSGQRPFTTTPECIWYNIDTQAVEPDRVPDIRCDVGREKLAISDSSVSYVVLHQVLEHFGCGESGPMLKECWRVLKPGGSLIITVPDLRKLCARWLGGELDTQIFMTNLYGAYMGDEADRHKWGGDEQSWTAYLRSVLGGDHAACTRPIGKCTCNGAMRPFDFREIPGADIANDWWVLGVEVVKP